MTIQSMHELFELVQDHFNTAYFPEEEITRFLNAGQKKIFNGLVFYGDSPSEPDTVKGVKYISKFELDPAKRAILSNCVLLDVDVVATAGLITNAAIDTATSRTTALITSVVNPNGDELKILREGEFNNFKKNYFTNAEYSLARLGNAGVLVDGGAAETYKVSLIAEPLDMDLTEPIQPTLNGVHELIVIEGLRLAGFAISDELLMQLKG